MMLAFVKIIIRCLYQKFNIIYVNESSINTINNNLKLRKESNDNFYAKIPSRQRFNLLMSVYEEGVLHFKINKENTKTNTFLEYINELFSIIKENISPYVIILDNLSCHKTEDLYNFYMDNTINVVFNAPYVSEFNSIEYAFRELKKILYSRIYSSESELINDIEKILKSSTFQKKVYFNLMDTCKNYLSFSKKEKDKNLNEID